MRFVLVTFLAAGCGTLVNHHSTADVPLIGAPSDLQVTVDGQPAKVTASGIEVPKKGTHEVTLRGDGREATWTYHPSINGGYILGDIFLTGLVGIVVDAVTGDWNSSSVAALDVGELLADGKLTQPPPAATAGAAKDAACEALVAHIGELVGQGDARGGQLGRVFATHCDQDVWPAEVKACVAGAKEGEGVGACARKLPSAQRAALFHDGDVVMGW